VADGGLHTRARRARPLQTWTPWIGVSILGGPKIRLDLMRAMELDSIECVSYSDSMDDDDDSVPSASVQIPRPFLKSASSVSPAAAAAAAVSLVAAPNRADANAGGGVGPLVPPATGVHELLECPVCTNSVYPPIRSALDSFLAFPFAGSLWGNQWRDPVRAGKMGSWLPLAVMGTSCSTYSVGLN
jgi:hypothetical protein